MYGLTEKNQKIIDRLPVSEKVKDIASWQWAMNGGVKEKPLYVTIPMYLTWIVASFVLCINYTNPSSFTESATFTVAILVWITIVWTGILLGGYVYAYKRKKGSSLFHKVNISAANGVWILIFKLLPWGLEALLLGVNGYVVTMSTLLLLIVGMGLFYWHCKYDFFALAEQVDAGTYHLVKKLEENPILRDLPVMRKLMPEVF